MHLQSLNDAALGQKVRFGVLTPEQKSKIEQARIASSGRNNTKPSPIEKVFDQFMSPPKPDITVLPKMPKMDASFAQQLMQAMKERIVNKFLGLMPEKTALGYRKELADIEEKLDKAPFTVPEAVVDQIAKSYRTASLSSR